MAALNSAFREFAKSFDNSGKPRVRQRQRTATHEINFLTSLLLDEMMTSQRLKAAIGTLASTTPMTTATSFSVSRSAPRPSRCHAGLVP